jgi:glycosyltransferase involved in cell wall biosynthesis
VKDDLVGLGVAGPDKIRVVPLGLELGRLASALPRGGLRRAAGVPAEAPVIGIVGRLAPIKDVPTFLAAAAAVRRAVPEARFAVVGDGEERSALEEEARQRGLDGAVHFHGWHRDMAAVYGDLDVVVNCSRNEGTPVALIEALAAGRPVIATAVGGTPDLLARGQHGTLVPPGDPEALARAIVEALRDPAAAAARAARGRAYVLRHHSAERLVDDVDQLYRQLLHLPVEAA